MTSWTVAYQAPLSMGFSRQECWSGLPFPSPGDLPDPGIKPGSSTLQADALPSEPPGKPPALRGWDYTGGMGLYRGYTREWRSWSHLGILSTPPTSRGLHRARAGQCGF